MSYVIQNFNNLDKLITITPRFLSAVVLKKLKLLLLFLKLNTLLFLNERFLKINQSWSFSFFRYFYAKNIRWLLDFTNLKKVSNFTNNEIKSSVYHLAKDLDDHLFFKKIPHERYFLEDSLVYNQPFISFKIANVVLLKKFFQNVFFFMLLHTLFIWNAHTSFIKFYMNFFFVEPHLLLLRFYNNIFFKIYSI